MVILKIISTFVTSAIAIYYGKKWKELSFLPRLGIVAAALTAVLTCYSNIKDYRTKILVDKINANFGDIRDIKGASIPIVQIGSSKTQIRIGDPDGIFFRTEEANLMQVYVIHGRLFVNVIVRDAKGKVLAVIDKNEWQRLESDYEYNDNETAFELIKSGDRKAIFQIDLKDGIARFSGLLVDEEGYGTLAYAKQGDTGSFFQRMSPNNKEFVMPAIKPIFKYPRERYYGIRAD